jgi:hypothetical protein
MFARGRGNQDYQRVNRSSFDGPNDIPLDGLEGLDPLSDDEQPATRRPPSKSHSSVRWLLGYICVNPIRLRIHPGRTRWKRILVRCLFFSFLAITALIIITPIFNPSYSRRPAHYTGGNPLNEKVFIAANIIDEDMIRGAWGKAVAELVETIGENNVFLSIYENDSGEGTKAALGELKARVKCKSIPLIMNKREILTVS